MIYRPARGAMWDPSIIFHDGRFHAFMMYNRDGSDGLAAGHCLLATSTNGVHWGGEEVVVEEREREKGTRFFKCFVGRCGDRFIMNHGVLRAGGQDTLRYYESYDLHHWTYIASNHPDPRWYAPTARWDHMYMLQKEEGRPASGFWGYPVAIARPELPRGVGMTQSTDGRAWEPLSPALVEWGDVPQNDFEWGGCERIGGSYYLVGGVGPYLANAGYSMFVFRSDNPRGPFRPDIESFRLCGCSGRDVSWLAAWCRGDGELLISNYASVEPGSRAPSLLPLRKPVVDGDGHLRLGWWAGNEKLKGERFALLRSSCDLETWLPESFLKVPCMSARSSAVTCLRWWGSRSPRQVRNRESCCSAWEHPRGARRTWEGSKPRTRPHSPSPSRIRREADARR
jgi:hypothetical protein